MDEQTVITRYFTGRQAAAADVRVGIGDDAAVLEPVAGRHLVLAMDALVEGTHFPVGTPAAAIGHRVLAVNLSDLAAMAAHPLWFTLALSLPAIDEAWLAAFTDGLFALADRHDVRLVGGDTVRGPCGATVTACGSVAPGCAVLRSGARPGDGIWVTGCPGEAVAGRLLAGQPAAGTLHDRFLWPRPRVREGVMLAGIASAMIDVSDGLHVDLSRLLAASAVGAELDIGALPVSSALREAMGPRTVECVLTGGDDYELCFCVPPDAQARLAAVSAGWDVPVTRIGTVTAGSGACWRIDGQAVPAPTGGFRHF